MADLGLGAVNMHVDVELALDHRRWPWEVREEKGVSFLKEK